MNRRQLLFLVCWLGLGALVSGQEAPGLSADRSSAANFRVPDPKDAVIYQVNLRAFSPKGDFAGVKARLDKIKDLGVNVIYLMPVYPVGQLRGINSPYCISDYSAIGTEFGNLEDARELVSEAHKRGMAVLFDWVADHTAWDHSWIAEKSWYRQDKDGNIVAPIVEWKDVAALNFSSVEMRKAMISAMKAWVEQANIDGYRCDASDFVPFDFWRQAIDSLNSAAGHKLLFFAEGTRKDNFAAGFHFKYGMVFYDNLKNIYAKKVSVRSLDRVNAVEYANAAPGDQVVRYLSNHDVDLSDGTPLALFGGKEGSLAAFIVAAYMKGVPMIYDGQEVGCAVKLTYFNNSTTIDWSLNPELTQTYKRIIALRRNSEAIKQGELQSFSSEDVCVFTKTYDQEKVMVLVNLRNKATSYEVPEALKDESWSDAFAETAFAFSKEITLQPFQYVVLKRALADPTKKTAADR